MKQEISHNLPAAPPGRTGWPWTDACEPLPLTRPNGSPWPRITIVTPSFNQGQFIEETIRSVLLQRYPNLQYMVIDGGSSDATVDVISRYAPWIDFWVSERDDGQTHAINKGLARADGEWFQFINSDDLLMPGALAAVGLAADSADAVAGHVIQCGLGPETLFSNRGLSAAHLLRHHGLTARSTYHQPGVFLRTDHVQATGGFDQTYRYVFDFHHMVLYLDRFPRVAWVQQAVARFRLHGTTKSVHEGHGFGAEFNRARNEISAKGLSPRNQRILETVLGRQNWSTEVAAARKTRSRPGFLGFLLQSVLGRPHVAANRFTLGALRRAMFAPNHQ